MSNLYWQRQSPGAPLFPDVEWNRPERRDLAGKLLIAGGTANGFLAIAESDRTARQLGAGDIRVVLPDALRKALPSDISETRFVNSTISGGLADDPVLREALDWCDLLLLPGDNGRSAETASLFESLLDNDKQIVATRDAADILIPSGRRLAERPQTTLVIAFAQLQKLLRSVYYPKMVVFSISLTLLVDTLHKFTLSYPITLVTYHQGHVIVAHDGHITTTPLENPMSIWRGTTAARAACYLLWTPQKPLEAITASLA